jgi:ribosomal protein L37AE/L43A
MKARIVYADLGANTGKLVKLEELHAAYRSYVQKCIDKMVSDQRTNVLPSERRLYFATSEVLSSQILKNAQAQAVDVLWTWVKQRYAQKLRKYVNLQPLTDLEKLQLRCVGKYQLRKAGKFGKGTISQEMVDLYWGWVWDPEVVGNPPVVSESFPMWMSEMTCGFGPSDDAKSFGWWLSASCLVRGKTVKIPLAFNPYLKSTEGLAKSCMVKKRNGRWTFQFCEKSSSEEPAFEGSLGKVGVDVGLNVIAATSDGRLYGARFKPRFDRLYERTKRLRANRFRQDLKEDSKRLARLESRLSGMTKSITGEIANKLVKAFPGHTFVIEDLDLRGCKGQKRFAYRKLQDSLSHKAAIEKVNPAYSSQMCPSCGYISRLNRKGTIFICQCCGRKSHADTVGGLNLLGRSEDKQVKSCENVSEVRSLLRQRFLLRRTSSSSRLAVEPKPNGQRFTTEVPSLEGIGTASNQVLASSLRKQV